MTVHFPARSVDHTRAVMNVFFPFLRSLLLTLLLWSVSLQVAPLQAQETPPVPAYWQEQLAASQLTFTWPASGDFRVYRRFDSDFQPTDFALWSRRARTEIRLLIQPEDTTRRRRLPWPHLEASRMVTHLADNEENTLIAAHDLDPAAVREVLGGHWARMYFFPPKELFAPYDHCRMLCFYREGVATAYVFFLFDDPPAELDEWLGILRFELPLE
jgi:hypothetical protein